MAMNKEQMFNWIRNNVYYVCKPFIPRSVQIFVRRKHIRLRVGKYDNIWPIDEKAGGCPENWGGWPGNKRFALVLTHDVDTARGHNNCRELIRLEERLGFRSSFNFVPERYKVSPELRGLLVSKGFEVGVHGLKHDGKYFVSRREFRERAARINRYIKDWDAVGYRSPSMQYNLEWFHDLDIEYDSSTFDTDPFEPQPDGMGTIHPFWVDGNRPGKGYVELPYTLPQDFTLFILMQEESIRIWKRKLDWIAERGGMALLNTHPDYISFGGPRQCGEEYPAAYYAGFLEYIKDRYRGEYWHVLPRDMARFWRDNVNVRKSPGE